MTAHAFGRLALPCLVLILAALAVAAYDGALEPYRYAYDVDSASYVEMANGLLTSGHPWVTPWDPGADPDAIPQVLFPPGFSVLIAALQPIAGDLLTAARWPGRWSAVWLPVAVLLLFRGAVGWPLLLCVAALTLLGPGVRAWHYVAYSDVPTLLLAVLALGSLARGLGWVGGRSGTPWFVASGLAAGIAYTFRNAALALVVASVAVLGYAAWVRVLRPRQALAWGIGFLPPVAMVLVYNLLTFGRLQPYEMPPSTRGLGQNSVDYVVSQWRELGIPPKLLTELPVLGFGLAALCLVATFFKVWRARQAPKVRGLIVLFGAYVAAGAVMLVVSRTRYEWGGNIDARYTLQYAWALALLLALLVGHTGQRWVPRLALAVGVALSLQLAWAGWMETRQWRDWGPQLWRLLSDDEAVKAAARAVPRETLLASNAATFFRLEARRPTRELEVGGTERDFVSSLGELVRLSGPRPTAFLLVCDEFTWQFSACGGAGSQGVVPPFCRPVRIQRPKVALCEPPAPKVEEAMQ
jgi:hypothetical protein